MSKVITQKVHVRTNTAKESICKVNVEPLKFADLWGNYPSAPPFVDPKTGKPPPGYSNQCAIKVSVAIHQSGIEMKSFKGASRILVNGKNTAALASDLADWLKKQPFCGLQQDHEGITGKIWEQKIKKRTGIVYFADYWKRKTDHETKPTGDHIDLWNGSRLTASGLVGTLVTTARYFGRDSFMPGNDWGYSDLGTSKEILFWEIK